MLTSILLIVLGTFRFRAQVDAQFDELPEAPSSYGEDEEDQYDEEYYSDEYEEPPITTTTEEPGIVLEGWHFGMMSAATAITLMFLGAVVGAVTALCRVRHADARFCACNEQPIPEELPAEVC